MTPTSNGPTTLEINMAIRVLSGRSAIEYFRSNPHAQQPRRGDPDNRLEPMCSPGFEPSFRFGLADRIFTIGSCFARHVESALIAHGFDVAIQNPEFRPLLKTIGLNALNNFGVPSIFNELSWALAGGFDPKLNFVEIAPGQYADLHLPPTVRPTSLDGVTRRRETIRRLIGQVVNCQVVIITLGLTELWFDTVSEQYLNFTPRKAVLTRFGDRFELHVLDYATTMSFLTRALELLRQACREPPKIVLTVSPVPLTATFTEQDVLVANCYSKSILRVAAQDAASSFPQVDYYPSFESVTLSNRDIAWDDDLRHVRPRLIELNVSRMVDAYTSDKTPASAAFKALDEARIYLDAGDAAAALERLGELHGHETSEELLVRAEASARLGAADDAFRALIAVPADTDGWLRSLTEIRVNIALTRFDNALVLAKDWAAREPKRGSAWQALAEAHIALSQWDHALEAALRWSTVDHKHGAPYTLLTQIHRRMGNANAAADAYQTGLAKKFESQALIFSYLDFLIEQQRHDDARRFANSITPENPVQEKQLRDMRMLIDG